MTLPHGWDLHGPRRMVGKSVGVEPPAPKTPTKLHSFPWQVALGEHLSDPADHNPAISNNLQSQVERLAAVPRAVQIIFFF